MMFISALPFIHSACIRNFNIRTNGLLSSIHSFTHSFIRSLTHSLTYSLIHSFIHQLIYNFIPSLLFHCCTHDDLLALIQTKPPVKMYSYVTNKIQKKSDSCYENRKKTNYVHSPSQVVSKVGDLFRFNPFSEASPTKYTLYYKNS